MTRLFPCVAALLVAACSGRSGSVSPQAPDAERVVVVTAKRYEFSPSEIHLQRGVPIVLEFRSLDRLHGFEAPELGLRTDISPGKPSRLRFVPDKAGHFPFHCDEFCGSGHEDMGGEIVVDP